jgi:ferrous iron transport protein B
MRIEISSKEQSESEILPVKKDVTTGRRTATLVLVGNPNVGKSIIFNYFSGMYAEVSNFPGTTISLISGRYKNYRLIDTPGIYGVSSFNDEEKVARDVILQADVILNVVNALNLERDLFLTLQLIEMGKKVSVILNMMDEVKRKNIIIDSEKLSQLLGVKVYETSAIKKIGFENLDEAIENARYGRTDKTLDEKLEEILKLTNSRPNALLLVEGDKSMLEKYEYREKDLRDDIYIHRRNRVKEIVDSIESEGTRQGIFFSKLGRMCLNPITGIPILLLILTIIYFFVGDVVSQRVVDFTENYIGKNYFEFHTKSFVAKFTETSIDVKILDLYENLLAQRTFYFPDGTDSDLKLLKEFKNYIENQNREIEFHFTQPLHKFLFGEFGVITMTVTYLLFLLLPLVLAFYFSLSLLEDSGYLPRLAALVDKTFNRIGLNGRAIIPIILGFGCVTMATITTRILGTEREKSIATAILQFVIPCSAQLAVVAVMLSRAGFEALIIYSLVIFTVMIITSTTLNKLIPGQSSPLLLDLPPMRLPRIGNVSKKTYYRTLGFLKEATLWFFVGAAGIGILQLTNLLQVWHEMLSPLTVHYLQLPKEAATAFVMGMIRRDFGAAGLFDLQLTTNQIIVALITITLFVPCIASFVIMLKERGLRQGIIIGIGTWFFAFLIGGIVSQIIN